MSDIDAWIDDVAQRRRALAARPTSRMSCGHHRVCGEVRTTTGGRRQVFCKWCEDLAKTTAAESRWNNIPQAVRDALAAYPADVLAICEALAEFGDMRRAAAVRLLVGMRMRSPQDQDDA